MEKQPQQPQSAPEDSVHNTTTMTSIPRKIGEFAILPIELPQPPSLTLPSPPTHFLYVRRNAPKVPTADDERSLFLSNVPVDATEQLFRIFFASLVGPGRFESVTFEEGRRRQRRASALNDDDDDSDDGSDSGFDERPRHAAALQDLQSRKRKRIAGGDGRGDGEGDSNDTSRKSAAAEQRRQAQLPPTWPQTLRRSGSTAVALFADAKSVDVVLKAIAKVHKSATSPTKFPAWPSSSSLGPSWLAAHNRMAYPNHATLLASVDTFFALFNRQEAEAAELARRLRNVPDEDGFVTVTRSSGGRSAPARQDEAASARAKQLEKQERQRLDMTNFYRFQLRERKKEEQAEMQRKFQEDRKRVAVMREKRGKFKPEA